MMKQCSFLVFVAFLMLAQSCSKEASADSTDIVPADSAALSSTEPIRESSSEEASVQALAGEATEETTTESEDRSLRDSFQVFDAPPVNDLPWSTALTLEERMANLERIMSTSEQPFVVDMHDFGGWEFDEGKKQPFPEHILALDGKQFTIRGFMMPDIDFENIRRFHLVRSLFSCCFGAPPQLNEILRVTLADKGGMEYTFNTLEVTGTLHVVFEMEDGLVDDLFRLENVTYRIIDFDDPEAPTGFDAATGFGDLLPTGPVEY